MDKRIKTIKDNVNDLQKIATLFYEGKTRDGFEAMEEGTQKILTIVENMIQIVNDNPSKGVLDINFINAALTEILNSYERKDAIMIADLLHFELLDYVNSVLEQWRE